MSIPQHPDARALNILSTRYWSSTGWRPEPDRGNWSTEDKACVIANNLYIEPVTTTHGQLIRGIEDVVKARPKTSIVNAFIYSLETRRLDMRSALGSLAVACSLHSHRAEPNRSPDPAYCSYCHGKLSMVDEDANVMNFERHKWGGVRHLDPLYIYLDLMQASDWGNIEPTRSQRELLTRILTALTTSPVSKLSDLPKLIQFVPGNPDERRRLINILGYAGIFKVEGYQPFYKSFVPAGLRRSSNYAKSDWAFPVDLWQPQWGFDHDAIRFWFSHAVAA